MPKARARHTCTECSLRRQQCDRRSPCGRCVKRGVPEKCHLQWDGQYDPAKHRVYPSKHAQLRPGPEQSSSMPNSTAEARILPRHPPTASLVPGLLSSQQSDRSETTIEPVESEAWRHARPTAPKPGYNFQPYQLEQLRKTRSERAAEPVSLLPDAPSGLAHCHIETFLQSLLPSVAHIWKLVDYHEQYLLWYHCCYHGPTFRRQLESVADGQDAQQILTVAGLELQWLALLFSIMVGSLTCTAEARLEDWGFSQHEAASLSVQWYKAVVTCLDHGEWTARHCRHSVQAVATLTMSAHALGRSSELSILLASAVKIAQAIGLDRLEYEDAIEHTDEASTAEQRHYALQRDLGRKVWSQLCVQDWMSAPSARSYMINPLHFSTTKPSSRDYLTMEFIPEDFPTYISYGNYLFDIAKLLALHHDATLQSTTSFTRYHQALEYDRRMRTLATKEMPRYFHVVEPVDVMWPEWVHWARSSLTISFSHKIIMIHRDFLKASFSDPAYTTTRMTCVAAAKTVLTESRKAKGMDGPIIWIDKAFCVVAGLVLCLDIRFRLEAEPERILHESLVKECIEQLSLFQDSAIASQGVKVLTEGLASCKSTNRSSTSDAFLSQLDCEGSRSTGIFPPQTGLSREWFTELFSV